MITCPKCGYTRRPTDQAPEYECPACGIVYAKYNAVAALREQIQEAQRTGDWSRIPPEHVPRGAIEQAVARMPVTTGLEIPGREIETLIDVVSAECAFGMNLLKDFFAGVSDVVGGRSGATQGVLRDARRRAMAELRAEAFSTGANAVIGVKLDYSEFSGDGKSMLFVVASGTAVKLK